MKNQQKTGPGKSWYLFLLGMLGPTVIITLSIIVLNRHQEAQQLTAMGQAQARELTRKGDVQGLKDLLWNTRNDIGYAKTAAADGLEALVGREKAAEIAYSLIDDRPVADKFLFSNNRALKEAALTFEEKTGRKLYRKRNPNSGLHLLY